MTRTRLVTVGCFVASAAVFVIASSAPFTATGSFIFASVVSALVLGIPRLFNRDERQPKIEFPPIPFVTGPHRVVLVSRGKSGKTIVVVYQTLGLPLINDGLRFVVRLPSVLVDGVSAEHAQEFVRRLHSVGAEAVVEDCDRPAEPSPA